MVGMIFLTAKQFLDLRPMVSGPASLRLSTFESHLP